MTATTLSLAPNLDDQIVLDIACGQGKATRALAAAGVRAAIGIDLSPELVAIAQQYEQVDSLGIDYRVDDAQILASVDDSSVDGVTCQLGLMDIPDLDATLNAVHRVLRTAGWFVFVIGHPCFLAPNATTLQNERGAAGRFVTDYFEERFWRSENQGGVRRVGNFHRTLSTYLNALVAHGFIVERIVEPAAEALLAEQQPVYSVVPIFLGGRASRR